MSRTLKVVLIASLALNLLVVGAIGGWMFKWKRHGGPWYGHGGIERQLFKFARDLPGQRRSELREQFRSRWKGMRPKFEDIKKTQEAAADVLTADPYDRQKLSAALQESRVRRGERLDGFSELFLDMVGQLTAEERKAFAAHLKERAAKPRRHRWRRRNRD